VGVSGIVARSGYTRDERALSKVVGILALAIASLACGNGRALPAASPKAVLPAPSVSTGQQATATSDAPVILFVGTSLTAGYGLDPDDAYPALIQSKLDAAGLRYRVVNAGVSGETSAGALRRVDWLMRQPVAVFVLETGANDGLRAQDVDALRDNIRAILDRARRQAPAPKLVLVGMKALTNYGADYGRRFEAVFPEVARETGALLVPFLLEGVGGVASLNQADGIHPTAAGQAKLAETVWKVLRPLLG